MVHHKENESKTFIYYVYQDVTLDKGAFTIECVLKSSGRSSLLQIDADGLYGTAHFDTKEEAIAVAKKSILRDNNMHKICVWGSPI